MDDGCSLPVDCLQSFEAVHTMSFAMKHIVGFDGLCFLSTEVEAIEYNLYNIFC